MKTNHPKHNWFVDVLLFVGFLLACWLELTGVQVHQWLGMAIGTFAMYHLVTHWAWVKNVAARFFGNTSGQARLFLLLDALLLFGLFLIIATGLIISTWFGLTLSTYNVWSMLHTLASVGTLGLLIVKIGLHWRWIVNVTQRYIVRPVTPMPAANPVSRREFLKLMGVVSVASVLPMMNALDALIQDQARLRNSNNVVQATTTIPATTTKSTTTSSTTATCTVRCSKACSYPGRCRKYVDSNNNSRCDLGECV